LELSNNPGLSFNSTNTTASVYDSQCLLILALALTLVPLMPVVDRLERSHSTVASVLKGA
jgi:hypothetical protein